MFYENEHDNAVWVKYKEIKPNEHVHHFGSISDNIHYYKKTCPTYFKSIYYYYQDPMPIILT